MALLLRLLVLATVVALQTQLIFALECYVCTRQEGNREKCLSTTRTCESDEDTCQTELRWGSTPYWSQGAEKQYYVTKRCAKAAQCKELVANFTSYCHRVWYEDWKCAECCQGDRCNYYIIMGAGSLRATWLVMIAAIASTVTYRAFFQG